MLRLRRSFRLLFLANVVSFIGDWFAFVAVSGFVVEETGRSDLAAIVYAANVLPVFFVAPLAGVLADRLDRRRLMTAICLLQVVPALGMLAALHLSSPSLAIACVALLASLSSFFEPLTAAVVPNLVEPGELDVAQAGMGSVWGSMLFVGAALGGLASATLGRGASFVLNAASFLVAAVLVWLIRDPLQRGAQQARAMGADLAELWALLRRSRVTRTLLVAKAGVGLGNGIVGLLPAYALARYQAGDGGIGLLLAARGLGAVLGPFLGQRLVRGRARALFVVVGASMLLYGSVYALLPQAATLSLAALCVVVAHLGGGAQWSLSTYGLQLATPDALRGRVMSLDFAIATLSIGLSALGGGVAAERFELPAASVGMALVTFVYGLFWLAWARPLWRTGAPEPWPGAR